MRFVCIIAILLCLIIQACNKPLPDYSKVPFEYTVSGFRDTAVKAGSSFYLAAKVNLVSGKAEDEPITLTFNGIPTDAYLDKNNLVFRANYMVSDLVQINSTAKGAYQLQAVFTNAHTATKTYDFTIIVY